MEDTVGAFTKPLPNYEVKEYFSWCNQIHEKSTATDISQCIQFQPLENESVLMWFCVWQILRLRSGDRYSSTCFTWAVKL